MEKKIKNKKICFFSPASYSFFDKNSKIAHGGAEMQMFLLAEYLSENTEYDIYFLAGNKIDPEIKNQTKIKLKKSIQLKQNENILIKLIKSIRYILKLAFLNPDILINTNANAIVGISVFYCKIFNKKFIFRTSSLIDVNKEYIKKNGLSGKVYKYGLTGASKIITQNNEHKNLLKKNHNINAEVLKNMFKISYRNTSEKKHILWVSRFAKIKNPELFFEIALHFFDEKFVMICPHNTENIETWKNLKKDAEKIKNLTFINKVPFTEIQKYFDKAKIFVNTSDFEGFPNTFLQAAQAKTPIVSLNVNPDNFITEYNCGIFSEGNFDKMLSEMKILLKNENELKIKGENLFKYLKNNHDFNIIGKRFINIIESVL
ncbi:MAG: glycosyltransferase family 4 protein [Bacteroidales bacterium]|nr:glycosyltransferase family 4 protein [Bacteroidales bacterium]